MKLVLASDHAGVALKARVLIQLGREGHEVTDLGTNTTEAVDYPDYAKAVALAVLSGQAERAILICGSGAGACVAANKFKGIRAATCHDSEAANPSTRANPNPRNSGERRRIVQAETATVSAKYTSAFSFSGRRTAGRVCGGTAAGTVK